MKLLVGLGNPGEKYENTRHNAGFLVLDALLKKLEPLKKTSWNEDKIAKALVKEAAWNGEKVLLAKPTTFMNNSGQAVASLLGKLKLKAEDLYVIHDDIDLPEGKIRIRFGGSAGGHKGVESIISTLKDDKFLRIRLGIGRSARLSETPKKGNHESVNNYVLSNFNSHEKGKLKEMTHHAIKDIDLILEHGIDLYMSKYNNQPPKKKMTKTTASQE